MIRPAVSDSGIFSQHARVLHPTGSFTDWRIFRLPPDALRLTDVDEAERGEKLRDIADLRLIKASARGAASPVIITFAPLHPDEPAAQRFPGLPHVTDAGETLCSANSLITYVLRTLFQRRWIRFADGICAAATPPGAAEWRRRGDAVLDFLQADGRLYIRTADGRPPDFATADLVVEEDVLPIGNCAFLRDVSQQERPALLFNSAFFLLEQDDTFHYHSALGEAHSLWAAAGVIERPPLFRRGALWQGRDKRWSFGLPALTDLAISLPNGLRLIYAGQAAGAWLPFSFNDEATAPVHVYTRYFGVESAGRVLGVTPHASGRLELTVVDRRVVGWKRGGGLPIPHNGFVISFAANALTAAEEDELLAVLATLPRIDYTFVTESLQGVEQALQTGPLLLRDGRSILHDRYLADVEQFWPSRFLADGSRQIGVVPTNYALDVDRTRAGRIGIGVDEAGDLLVVMAAGVNDGFGIPGVDSVGATLAELAEALRVQGAVHAVNLDGGGSTQAYFNGQRALIPGDRREQPGKIFERMVPAVGMA